MRGKPAIPVDEYPSLKAASRSLGVCTRTIRHHQKRYGTLDHLQAKLATPPKKYARNVRTRMEQDGVVAGMGLRQLVASLDPDVGQWFLDQVPEGGTLAEMVSALIVDAYDDDCSARAKW